MALAYALYGLHAFWRIRRFERPAISDQKTEYKFHTPDGQSTPETMQLDPAQKAHLARVDYCVCGAFTLCGAMESLCSR